jgi:hypothetical protein
MIFSRRAQSVMEYVMLISIITAAVVFMLPRVKRTTQSMIKSAADQVGYQNGAEQEFNDISSGFLVSSGSVTKTFLNKTRKDFLGNVDQDFTERSESAENSQLNMGWSRD